MVNGVKTASSRSPSSATSAFVFGSAGGRQSVATNDVALSWPLRGRLRGACGRTVLPEAARARLERLAARRPHPSSAGRVARGVQDGHATARLGSSFRRAPASPASAQDHHVRLLRLARSVCNSAGREAAGASSGQRGAAMQASGGGQRLHQREQEADTRSLKLSLLVRTHARDATRRRDDTRLETHACSSPSSGARKAWS